MTQSDVLPGVASVLRDLAARRLARSYTGLAALGVLSLVEWTLSGLTSTVPLLALCGTPLSALALFGVGWKGVREGAGEPPAPWMFWATAGSVIPWLHGVFVFGVAGLQRLAAGGWGLWGALTGVLYAYLGLRLLRDAVKVAEVGRLGVAMAIPAPEERQG